MSLVPQFGFVELFFLAALALIVIGPKDLPVMMRSLGRMTAKARAMAREFQTSFDQMAREAELEELRKEIDDIKRNNPVSAVKRDLKGAMAPVDDAARKLDSDAKSATAPATKGDAAP